MGARWERSTDQSREAYCGDEDQEPRYGQHDQCPVALADRRTAMKRPSGTDCAPNKKNEKAEQRDWNRHDIEKERGSACEARTPFGNEYEPKVDG
jgi:hypothetical protein